MRAVFLDRDGVINRKAPEGEYIATWADMRFLPGAVASVAALSRAGFQIIVVTNQRGIALGKVRLEDLEEMHRRMKARFSRHGAVVTDVYFCPHDISEDCSCRKPKPGLLLQAAKDHMLDLSSCWMIGDAASDIEAGRKAGCRTAWILRDDSWPRNGPQADLRARNLASAAGKILRVLAGS
jgi:D-glycero-D-manno-heptose 1,7-bisphosphate phosphatase